MKIEHVKVNKAKTYDSLFGHNFFAVDKFGGCRAGSEISSTPGATEGCTGEIGEPVNKER